MPSFHGLASHHLAEPPVAVDNGQRVGVGDDFELGGEVDELLFHPADIAGDAHHAVGVVTGEISLDQGAGHDLGVVVARPGGGEN